MMPSLIWARLAIDQQRARSHPDRVHTHQHRYFSLKLSEDRCFR
jgi:hypothetical protein